MQVWIEDKLVGILDIPKPEKHANVVQLFMTSIEDFAVSGWNDVELFEPSSKVVTLKMTFRNVRIDDNLMRREELDLFRIIKAHNIDGDEMETLKSAEKMQTIFRWRVILATVEEVESIFEHPNFRMI